MSVFLFFLFSILETYTIYILTMVMFTFRVKDYWWESLAGSVVLTIISYFMRNQSLGIFDVMLQPVLFIFILVLLFRIRAFYATLLSFSYITYVMLQLTIIMILKVTGLIEIWVSPYDFGGNVIQSMSILISVVLIVLMHEFDWRYSFVPTTKKTLVKMNNANVLLVALIAAEIVSLGFFYYFYRYNFNLTFFLMSVVMFTVTWLVMKMLNKKEFSYG